MSRETANSEFKNLKQGLQAGWYQTETYKKSNFFSGGRKELQFYQFTLNTMFTTKPEIENSTHIIQK